MAYTAALARRSQVLIPYKKLLKTANCMQADHLNTRFLKFNYVATTIVFVKFRGRARGRTKRVGVGLAPFKS